MNITEENLAQFTGTESYHRWWIPAFVLTDGARYLAVNGAAWLIDAIASYLKRYQDNYMTVVTLTVQDGKGVLEGIGDEEKVIFRQEIHYTDFPLPEVKLFVAPVDEKTFAICLMSEY